MHTNTALLRPIVTHVTFNWNEFSLGSAPNGGQNSIQTYWRSLSRLVPRLWHGSVIHKPVGVQVPYAVTVLGEGCSGVAGLERVRGRFGLAGGKENWPPSPSPPSARLRLSLGALKKNLKKHCQDWSFCTLSEGAELGPINSLRRRDRFVAKDR